MPASTINWRLYPRPPANLPCKGAFVTHVSGEKFVPYAQCLVRQLRRVNTTCEIVIVHDDLALSRRLSAKALAALSRVRATLIPLSSLVRRALSDPAIAWRGPLPMVISSAARDGRTAAAAAASNPPRRRLVVKDYFSSTANKYYLWALDPARFPLAVYLDIDVAVFSNLDALLHLEFAEPIAAVGAAPLCQSRSFNSGLLVFKPSMATLAKLLFAGRAVSWPWRGCVCAAPVYGSSLCLSVQLLTTAARHGCY